VRVQARATYEEGLARHGRALAGLDARSRTFGIARLTIAAAAIVLVGGIVWGGLGLWAWAALGVLAIAFVVLVVAHARVNDAAERSKAAVRFHSKGLARLDLAWASLSDQSARFRTPDHPFASDLDVFGRASLMQLVDATETRFGQERLAALLALEGRGHWPDDALARQAAARDLAGRFAFREGLATAGAILDDDKPDAAALVTWAEAPAEPVSTLVRGLAWVQPAVVVALLASGTSLGLSAGAITGLCVAAIAVGLAVAGRLAPTLETVSAKESAVTRWRAMLAAIEREPFEAPRLASLRAGLESDGARASGELGRLERIVGFTDARRNEVFRFFIGPLLMWDVHCAVALQAWRARGGRRLRTWLDVLSETEALASLGGFAFEHPEFAWPDLVSEPMFEGRGVGHPLIAAERRVGNDVHLSAPGRALVVTGSNMSGKSTLLRAIGANAVLAFAGAPTCAVALRVGPMRIATSMRVEDSLEQGVSHFYAELRRLKRVLDLARQAGDAGASNEATPAARRAPVLYLLDEILHGTNSRERIIGACAVVRELVALGALGAVSTHDLGITALERELPGRVENAHLEEQVQGDSMTFDYVLRPGIVQSSNALRLMRAVGIEVPDAGDVP
jgi:hypothetical protein